LKKNNYQNTVNDRPVSLTFRLDALSPTAALLGDGSAAIYLVRQFQYSTDVDTMDHTECRPRGTCTSWSCKNRSRQNIAG